MAFKYLDDCGDHYANSDLLRMWTQAYGGLDLAQYLISSGGGRRGTNAIQLLGVPSGAAFQALGRVVTPGTTTALVGFAFKGSGSAASWSDLYGLGRGGNSLNLVAANLGAQDVRVNTIASIRYDYYTHVALSINTNGTISVYRGNANSAGGAGLSGQDRIAATLGTTSNALAYDTYNYIELKVVIHPSAGSVLLKVNGDEWLNVSGVRTQADGASSTTAWQELAIGANLSGDPTAAWYYDDLYLGDTDTTDAFNQMNDLVGDIAINYANVFDDGTTLDWTPLSGVDHYPMVDEIPPDLDVTYNYTTLVGAIDTFLKNAVPVVGAPVVALSPIYLRRRTEGGPTSTSAAIRDAGTNYSGSNAGSGLAEGDPSDYVYNWWTVTQRPSAAGTPLTQALVDAMEVGYEKVT